MTLDEAKERLNACVRDSLVDHTFGDAEVYWMDGEVEVASGYFGREVSEVSINATRFEGEDAKILRACGRRGRVDRNDGQF